jgi:NTP pyrophosphatase (non-canonical NTP hydrolase)
MISRNEVIEKVIAERDRQDAKWGFPQRNSPFEWVSILTEEVGELAEAINNSLLGGDGDMTKAIEEAIQVSAVAMSIVEHIYPKSEDHRDGGSNGKE